MFLLALYSIATVVATMSEAVHQYSTATLIKALHALSRDIQTDDGVVNACLTEAAHRMQELVNIQQFLEWKIAAMMDGIDVRQVSLDEWRDLRRN